MMNNNKVSIATKPLVYSAFRYIENKVWNALAEYVDNAIQSFKDHIDILGEINPLKKLRVEINIDIEQDNITITDNAFGITNETYDKAFELANIPLDRNGLNEFGMGMKVSSIWLSDLWTVKTKAYGEKFIKTLVFDIHEVTQNQELELPISLENANTQEHYTVITLTKLSQNKPRVRQIPYVKKHLASIYSKYIRDGLLDLIVNGELLEDTQLQCLVAPYYKTPEAESKEWKVDINFEVPKWDEFGHQIGVYYAKGFIGILDKMSTSENNGILLFRRGRVIGSSFDEKYRPKFLSGEEGSPRYKRIFGELELDGFDVSFTKSSFQDDDQFNAFIEVLSDDIKKNKSLDLFGQAQNYTKSKTQADKTKAAKRLVKSIADEISKPIIIPDEDISEPIISVPNNLTPCAPATSEEGQDNVTVNNSIVADNTQSTANDSIEIPAIEIEVNPTANTSYKIVINGTSENSNNGLYSLISRDGKYYATINLSNAFFTRFRDCLSSDDNIQQLAYFIRTLVVTELLLINSGTRAAVSFRNKFNQLFGLI